jgi:hypothetical protein
METSMLSERDIREIFRAFILTGQIAPSPALLRGLAGACGKTEEVLREEYKVYWKFLTGSGNDPFEE